MTLALPIKKKNDSSIEVFLFQDCVGSSTPLKQSSKFGCLTNLELFLVESSVGCWGASVISKKVFLLLELCRIINRIGTGHLGEEEVQHWQDTTNCLDPVMAGMQLRWMLWAFLVKVVRSYSLRLQLHNYRFLWWMAVGSPAQQIPSHMATRLGGGSPTQMAMHYQQRDLSLGHLGLCSW